MGENIEDTLLVCKVRIDEEGGVKAKYKELSRLLKRGVISQKAHSDAVAALDAIENGDKSLLPRFNGL